MNHASFTLTGTGHRLDKLSEGYTEAGRDRLVSLARWALVKYKPTAVISGMAQGWDQALAEAAMSYGIPFDAAVPFLGQEKQWPRESVERYRNLLSKARTVIVVCNGGYAAWKMQKRNEWMSDHADGLLALWNGSDGGTANCVRYAQDKHPAKPIYNVWDEWMRREVARLREATVKK